MGVAPFHNAVENNQFCKFVNEKIVKKATLRMKDSCIAMKDACTHTK